MNNKRPSTVKIIWADYWAFLSTAVSVLAAGFYAYNTFLSAKPIQGLDLCVIAAAVLGLVGLIWRTMSVSSLINNGIETKATISEISFYRDRGFIKYVYTHEGKKFASKTSVIKTKATRSFQVGQKVTIVADRENPQKTLLKDLFV